MTTLHIELPDEVKDQLAARAVEAGFSSVEQYARAVLQASAEAAVDEDELESLLAARAADGRPGIEFTPAFADAFRAEVRGRREPGGRP